LFLMEIEVRGLLFLLISLGAVFAQSVDRENAEGVVNARIIRINYGRPSLGGESSEARFEAARVGTVWRLGIDEATEISSTGDLIVAGKRVPRGRYSLWARKLGPEQWSLAFHPKTGIPGLPELKDGFIAEVPLELTRVSSYNDRLLILIAPQGNDARISIYWGASKLECLIGVVG
jgi:hypothetical protein